MDENVLFPTNSYPWKNCFKANGSLLFTEKAAFMFLKRVFSMYIHLHHGSTSVDPLRTLIPTLFFLLVLSSDFYSVLSKWAKVNATTNNAIFCYMKSPPTSTVDMRSKQAHCPQLSLSTLKTLVVVFFNS